MGSGEGETLPRGADPTSGLVGHREMWR
jgi:hypothetical protein